MNVFFVLMGGCGLAGLVVIYANLFGAFRHFDVYLTTLDIIIFVGYLFLIAGLIALAF